MTRRSPWDLDFAESRKAAQKHLGAKIEVLRPMIRFGHEVLRDCRPVCRTEVDAAVATSFRQCLEFADSVDLQLRHLMIAPAAVQSRSALECAAQATYLAQKQDPVLAAAYIITPMLQMQHEMSRKIKAPGLDEDDRNEIQARADEISMTLDQFVHDEAGRQARAALQSLRSRDPWYSILAGPHDIHQLLKAIGAEGLSHHYSALNPVVHGSMAHLWVDFSSRDPMDSDATAWLRPLRSPSPWEFRPILATGAALKLGLYHLLVHFTPRMPELITRATEFAREHKKICTKAGLAVLSL